MLQVINYIPCKGVLDSGLIFFRSKIFQKNTSHTCKSSCRFVFIVVLTSHLGLHWVFPPLDCNTVWWVSLWEDHGQNGHGILESRNHTTLWQTQVNRYSVCYGSQICQRFTLQKNVWHVCQEQNLGVYSAWSVWIESVFWPARTSLTIPNSFMEFIEKES